MYHVALARGLADGMACLVGRSPTRPGRALFLRQRSARVGRQPYQCMSVTCRGRFPHEWQGRVQHRGLVRARALAAPPSPSGSLSGSVDEEEEEVVESHDERSHRAPPPLLTLEELHRLNSVRDGTVYSAGVVRSPHELAKRLGSCTTRGLCEDHGALAARAERYGSNAFSTQEGVSFWHMVAEALEDFTVLTLIGAGGISLLLSLLVAHSGGEEDGPSWVEGASILASVAVVVAVGAGNNWQKERQFHALRGLQRDHAVRVVRRGAEQSISVQDVLVGDVLLIETGDILDVDGVLLSGAGVRLDESALTGEAVEVAAHPVGRPLVLSGSRVVGGSGRVLVTGVGAHSAQGAIAAAVAKRKGGGGDLDESTQLQQKLEVYASAIGKFGIAAAGVATTALIARFCWGQYVIDHRFCAWSDVPELLDAIIVGITILVVAVPEGLPLAVTLSLALSVRKMLADNNLVRQLQASETMGTATVICSDKTGTLTQNAMVLASLWMAGEEVQGLATVQQEMMRKLPFVVRTAKAGKHGMFSGLSSRYLKDKGPAARCILWWRRFKRELAMKKRSTDNSRRSLSSASAHEETHGVVDDQIVQESTLSSSQGDSLETMMNHIASGAASPPTGDTQQQQQHPVDNESAAAQAARATPNNGVDDHHHHSRPNPLVSKLRASFSELQIKLLLSSIILNTDASVHQDAAGVVHESGSSTELALLRLALHSGVHQKGDAWRRAHLLTRLPFSYERRRSSVVVHGDVGWQKSDGLSYFKEPMVQVRAFTKGAPEVLLAECCKWQLGPDGKPQPIDLESLEPFLKRCQHAGQRTFAIAFRDFTIPSHSLTRYKFSATASSTVSSMSSADEGDWEVDPAIAEEFEKDMILLAVCSIEDPLRPEVPAAIVAARHAGIKVKMLTGDNVVTATAIARQAGILPRGKENENGGLVSGLLGSPLASKAIIGGQAGPITLGGANPPSKPGSEKHNAVTTGEEKYAIDSALQADHAADNQPSNKVLLPTPTLKVTRQPLHQYTVMQGEDFRALVCRPDGSINCARFLEIWPHLRVLARCTPQDKLAIVMGARQCTEDIVAVTGDGTNDAPALRAAHVGFAMNQGTDIAKEAADIILLDNNFASIVSAALWGRNVYASITRFLQFQLTTNIVAVVTAVVGSVAHTRSPLTAVQMLWVNLMMDSLAGLALASGKPSTRLLERKPFGRDHRFLAPGSTSRKHVIGQAAFQLLVMSALIVGGPRFLGIAPGDTFPRGTPSLHYTIVFNTFVWMQLFNQLNSRLTMDASGLLEGLSNAPLFGAVLSAEAIIQVLIVQYGGKMMQTEPLNAEQWVFCISTGALSLVVHELLKMIGPSKGKQHSREEEEDEEEGGGQ